MIITEPATGPLPEFRVADLAEALFCSSVQPSWHAGPDEIRAAVLASLHEHHDSLTECAEELAQRYGDDPETACSRMRWCRDQVSTAYVKASHHN